MHLELARRQMSMLLGYSFWVAPGQLIRRRVAPKALQDFKKRVQEITSRN